MKKKILGLLLAAIILFASTTHVQAATKYAYCNGKITYAVGGSYKVTMYDNYDGHVYSFTSDTHRYEVGYKVNVKFDTRGTSSVKDDRVVSVTKGWK